MNKADSASIWGTIHLAAGMYFAQGTVLRSYSGDITLKGNGAVLENSVILGNAKLPTSIGEKVVFGHRNFVIGVSIGNLCEIGNGCILMPNSQIGDWCILGEGTLIPEGRVIPDRSVVVGRPGRVIRSLTEADEAMITRMRGGNISLTQAEPQPFQNLITQGHSMGKLYAYKDKSPQVSESTFLFDSTEITGDVIIGEHCIIGAGVKIVGDSHGPVRIGNHVQILENSVLHLLPDNQLIIEDHVVIGPGCMIHGCTIGAHSVVEPGAIICDYSQLGANSLVKAGSMVKQRSQFPEYSLIEGFPAKVVESFSSPPSVPEWAFAIDELQTLTLQS